MITIYALGAGKYPALFDSSGADITNKKTLWPAAHFGITEKVAVRPVKDGFEPYTKAELEEFVSFDFGIDTDWNVDTDAPIRTITGFSIEEVKVIEVEADPELGIAEVSKTWAQIVFWVNHGTDEIKAKMAGKTLPLSTTAELDGYRAGEAQPGLITQFPYLILGRIIEGGTGTANPVSDGHLTAAQVYALLAAYAKCYPADGPLTFTKDDVDSETKLYSVNHGLGQKWGLGVSIYSEDSGVEIHPDDIIPVDADNLNVDFAIDYADMTGNYYLRIRK